MGKTVNRSDPYRKVKFRGVTLDERTKSAFLWAEKRYIAQAPNKRGPLRIGQGSYNKGGVEGSAGTHDGGGVLDVMFAGLNSKQRAGVLKWFRRAGFAFWRREGAAWGKNNDHGHGVLLGHRNASLAAKAQMASYRAHRDGLAYNGYDGSWRPKRGRRWSHRQNRPIIKR